MSYQTKKSQSRRTSTKPVQKKEIQQIVPQRQKPDHIVGEKNCFIEVQKRKFFQKIAEPQDIYSGRRVQENYELFAPLDKKDEMIAHEAELLPPCSKEEKFKKIARNNLTEEALDDWIAQSINRSIPEILDPKKKFNIPNIIKSIFYKEQEIVCEDEEEIFLRGLLDDDSIVDRKTLEEKKKQFKKRKAKNISESFFLQKAKDKTLDLKIESKKLEPKTYKIELILIYNRNIAGTFIKPPTTRQNSLSSDTLNKNNEMFSSLSNKNAPATQTPYNAYNPKVQQSIQLRKRQNTNIFQQEDSQDINEYKNPNFRQLSLESSIQSNPANKLFTLNISNFLRKGNNDKNTQTSMAEKELNFIEGLMNKQNERKQQEEQSKEQKKNSVDYFKEIQKQNRKELNKIVKDAISYCQNPPELNNFQLMSNTTQAVTKEKRPSSSRGQSRGQQKRFFILTKLQSKPSTAQSGQRQRSMTINLTTNQQTDKFDTSVQQTKQSFYFKTQQQTEEQQFSNKKLNNYFDPYESNDNIKIQNDSPLKNTINSNTNNNEQKIQINKFYDSGNTQNSNSSFFYSSLRTYKQTKMDEIRQRITLKELTKDYINQDQNKGTTIFSSNNFSKFQQKSRLKASSHHSNNSFHSNYNSNQNNKYNSNQHNNFYSNFDQNDSVHSKQNDSIISKRNEFIQKQKSDTNNSMMQNNSFQKLEKKQAELPDQVEKLLNSGSEDNLLKPNDDFANLVLHLEELKINQKKQEHEMSNAEFWFYKSWKLIEKGQTEVATQCLKQVLIQDKLHYKSIFNMGSLYEKIKKFNTALEWLKISKEFEDNQEQTIYGIALCYYKIKNFQESYENINQLIHSIEDKDEPPSRYIYLRALCLKQLGRIQEAEDDYKIFYKKTSPKNFDLLMHFMILFSFKYKNKIAKYQDLEIKYSSRTFCNFHSAIQQIVQGEYFEMKLGNFYNNKIGWTKTDKLIQIMQNLSFFKRFAVPLLKKSLPYLEHNLIEKEKLINPKNDEIYIIIAGNVQVFDHSRNYEKPDIVSYYTEGDIIGCDQLENNLSTKPNVWLISQTPIEYVKMQKSLFLDMWKGQYTLDRERITSLLRNCPMFKGISEISMLKLSYELVSIEEYQLNDILYNDGSFLETMNFNYIEMKKCSQKRGAGIVKRIIQQMTIFSGGYKMTKLRKLLIKHKQKIKTFMWNSKIIKGFYIIIEGIIQVENNQGWSYLLTPGDFFGENLMFKVKALSNFGRMRAQSEVVKVLFFPRDKFNQINSLDRAIMKNNCMKREQIENIEYLSKRYTEVRNLKLKRKREEEEELLKNETDEEFIQNIY